MITILIADDSEIIRAAIKRLLAKDSNLTVVGEATCFEETLKQTTQLNPRVVLLDCYMPDSEIILPAQIKDFFNNVESRLLAISVSNDKETKLLAEEFGAPVLLDKANFYQELIPAINEIAAR